MGYKQTAGHRPGRSSYHQVGLVRGQFGDVDYDEWLDFLAEAGFDVGFDGADSHSIMYQNANNSVRVTDEFMQAVESDGDWDLRAVTDSAVIETVQARGLFRQMGQAAWECADPGVQFDTTINHWNTASNTGRITASNPCSEYVHLENSACNLASINLLAF